MTSRAEQQTGRRVRRKKVSRARKPRTHERKQRNAAGVLAAICVFAIMFCLLLFLLLPFLTREKVLTVDMNGQLSVQDQPKRFQRAIE